ncbi:MAG: ferrous iron transport protein B [Anaerolineales bacterium]|jgi:ferrous iron transport protein B
MTNPDSNPALKIDYGPVIEPEIENLRALIEERFVLPDEIKPRWLAIKLLEGETDLLEHLLGGEDARVLLARAHSTRVRLEAQVPEGLEIAIADRRYERVGRIVEQSLTRPKEPARSRAEQADRVVTHPWLGIPIFMMVMYLVFSLVVNVSEPYLEWIDAVISGPISNWAGVLLSSIGASTWLRGLILEGAIAGVGGVLVFIPGLVVLFFFIGLLEDSGYLARVAFVMNRFLAFLGLNGKSFVPLILGFGCAVPGVYATRTLEGRRDRLLTALLVPLMSCSARLPVYVVFGMAFFGRSADGVIWSLYALGIAMAVLLGFVYSRTLLRSSESMAFLMELPAYRLPRLSNLWIHVSLRTGMFIRNAGTLILAASMVVWLFLNVPPKAPGLEQSVFGQVSGFVAPVLEPAGFGTWEASGSLLTGMVAKELVIATMTQIYLDEPGEAESESETDLLQDLFDIGRGFIGATISAGERLLDALTPGVQLFGGEEEREEGGTALSYSLQNSFTPLSALAFIVFVSLYTPCVATLGAIRAEFGGRWALFSAVSQTGMAWLVATLVFQLGHLLGLT